MDIAITEKRWKGENVSTIEVSNTISEENEWLNETNCYGVKIPWAEGACGALGITLDSGATTLTGIQTGSPNRKYESEVAKYFSRRKKTALRHRSEEYASISKTSFCSCSSRNGSYRNIQGAYDKIDTWLGCDC